MNSDIKGIDVPLQLQTRVRQPAELAPTERQQMYRLMCDHYENVDRSDFQRDLDEKQWVIVTMDPTRGVLGFTTLTRLTAQLGSERLQALFSGDTVLHPAIWGANSWARVWGRHAAKVIREAGESPFYWLLLTATHRTYRFLPNFLKEYYPRQDVPTPSSFQQRIDALVRLKFADEYDANSGIVRAKKPMRVRSDRIELAATGITEPDGQFFSQKNPGYLNGDYLVCIGDLSSANRTRLGRRFFNDRTDQ